MKFLEDIQKFFKIFGYCEYDRKKLLPTYLGHLFTSILIIWINIASIAYSVDGENPLDRRMYATMQSIGSFMVYGVHISLSYEKSNTSVFFDHFEMIINRRCRESDDVVAIYSTAETITSNIGKYVMKISLSVYNAVYLFLFVNVIICKIILGNSQSDPSTWNMMLVLYFPFDQHTVGGYLWCYILNIIVANYMATSLVKYGQYFLGSCEYLKAFCKDFALSFDNIDKLSETCIGCDYEVLLNEKLRQAIRFQVEIIDFYNRMTEIFNGFILSMMTGGSSLIATLLYQLDVNSGQFDVNFWRSVINVMSGVAMTLPFCYVASNALDELNSMDKCIYNIAWYKLPLKQQRCIKLLLTPMHTRELSGYGFVNCSLITFAKIVKTAASLYLMIKSL